jgi:hypothetical protein
MPVGTRTKPSGRQTLPEHPRICGGSDCAVTADGDVTGNWSEQLTFDWEFSGN